MRALIVAMLVVAAFLGGIHFERERVRLSLDAQQKEVNRLMARFNAFGAALWTAEPSWQMGAVEFLFVGWVIASTRMLSIHAHGIATAWWLGVATQCTLASFLYFTLFVLLVNNAINYTVIDMHMPFYTLEWIAHHLSSRFRYLLAAWAFAPVVGLLCVFTHWYLGSPGGNCDG